MFLTDEIIGVASYEGKSYRTKGGRKRWTEWVVWDQGPPGLGVRITSRNKKSFIVRYVARGRQRTKTLGPVGKLSLDEARQQARELLGPEVDVPAAASIGKAAAPAPVPVDSVDTVAQLADLYLERHLKPNAPSWYAQQRLIRAQIKPLLGRTRLGEVTPALMSSFRARLASKFPAESRKVSELVNEMFDWAEQRGFEARDGEPKADATADDGEQPAAAAAVDGDTMTDTSPSTPAAADELTDRLLVAETRGLELQRQLEEVSASGARMLRQISEMSAARQELEAELERTRRELSRARSARRAGEWPQAATSVTANLKASVEQLMDSLDESETARRKLQAELDEAEKRERALRQELAAPRRRQVGAAPAANPSPLRASGPAGRAAAAPRRHAGLLLVVAALGGAVVGALLMLVLGPTAETSAVAEAGTPPTTTSAPAAVVPVAPDRAGAAAPTAEQDPVSAGRPAATPGPARPQVAAAEPARASLEAGPDLGAVATTVRAWATAWSEQRIEDYLGFYADSFAPAGTLDRQTWEAQRRDRVLRPRSIRVVVGTLDQEALEPGRVRVIFLQEYATESYQDRVRKTLELVWRGGAWKIDRETSD